MRIGLCTGPLAEVCEPPEKQNSSQTALPAIVAPASSSRVTTVASTVGMKPSIVDEPFIIGTPATQTLSLIATVLPASLPPLAPLIVAFAYQAPYLLSSPVGRVAAPRGYLTSGR